MEIVYIFLTLAAIGLLIFVHELGHFLLALKCGVKVEVFSLGFGPTLFSVKRGNTEYKIGAIPFGGYVKMKGQEDGVAEEGTGEEDDYNTKTAWQRAQIIAAGPLVNLAFGGLAIFVALMWGRPVMPAVIGMVSHTSSAYTHLHAGDRVLSINGKHIENFQKMAMEVALNGGNTPITLVVSDSENKKRTVNIIPTFNKARGISELGIAPVMSKRFPIGATSSVVVEGATDEASPAGKIGIAAYDAIVSVNGRAISGVVGLHEALFVSDTEPIMLGVLREDSLYTVEVQPEYRPYGLGVNLLKTENNTWKVLDEIANVSLKEYTSDIRVYEKDNAKANERIKQFLISGLNEGVIIEHILLPGINEAENFDAVEIFEKWKTNEQLITFRVNNKDVISEVNVMFGSWSEDGEILVSQCLQQESFRRKVMNRWGARGNDELITVNIDRTPRKDKSVRFNHWLARKKVELVWKRDGEERITTVNADEVLTLLWPQIGVRLNRKNIMRIGSIDSKNNQSGLRAGDTIVSAGIEIKSKNSSRLELVVQRGAEIKDFGVVKKMPEKITPWMERRLKGEDSSNKIQLTVLSNANDTSVSSLVLYGTPEKEFVKYGVVGALKRTPSEVADMVLKTYQTLGALLGGKLSHTAISGPVGILSITYSQIQDGFGIATFFLAYISINLAVVNLLPIPVLDGGHLAFLFYEGVFRRRPSEKIQQWAINFGVVCLLSLILYVTWQDISKLINGLL